MARSHTPLSVWFWSAYLVSSQTPGMSVSFGDNLACRGAAPYMLCVGNNRIGKRQETNLAYPVVTHSH